MLRLRATLSTLAACTLLAGCGGDAGAPAHPSIVGTWEVVAVTLRDAPGDDFTYDDADPTLIVQVSVRANGIFTARYEGDGRVTSIMGTWRRSGEGGADRFAVRLATVDGVAVPAETRDRREEVFVTGAQVMRDGVMQPRDPAQPGAGGVQTLWFPRFDFSARQFTEVRLTLSRQR
jgi:hypothetical protein